MTRTSICLYLQNIFFSLERKFMCDKCSTNKTAFLPGWDFYRVFGVYTKCTRVLEDGKSNDGQFVVKPREPFAFYSDMNAFSCRRLSSVCANVLSAVNACNVVPFSQIVFSLFKAIRGLM